MKKLALIGTLLFATATAGVAHADRTGDAEQAHSVDAAGDSDNADGPGKEADDVLKDPSKHFNYFNFKGWWAGQDELGGPYGDGKMVNPRTGKVVMGEDGQPEEEEPMSAPFVFMLFNFAVFVWILKKYGGPAAKQLAEERHDAIKSALDEAAKLRDQAAAKLKEYEVRLKDSDAEIKKLVDGMKADAEAEKARILAAAEAQSQTMKREADARIAAEIQLARERLTREVTLAATAATEKILRERVTADDQNRLVNAFLTDLGGPRSTTRDFPKEPG